MLVEEWESTSRGNLNSTRQYRTFSQLISHRFCKIFECQHDVLVVQRFLRGTWFSFLDFSDRPTSFLEALALTAWLTLLKYEYSFWHRRSCRTEKTMIQFYNVANNILLDHFYLLKLCRTVHSSTFRKKVSIGTIKIKVFNTYSVSFLLNILASYSILKLKQLVIVSYN